MVGLDFPSQGLLTTVPWGWEERDGEGKQGDRWAAITRLQKAGTFGRCAICTISTHRDGQGHTVSSVPHTATKLYQWLREV